MDKLASMFDDIKNGEAISLDLVPLIYRAAINQDDSDETYDFLQNK
jgi:hypothetical protein